MLAETTAELNLRTIAQLAGVSQAQASRLLPSLVELGVIERREVPPSSLIRLVPEHVASRALLSLAGSGDLVLEEIGRLAAALPHPAVSVVVLGSFARRDAEVDSDIDLLVVRPSTMGEDDAIWADSLETWRNDLRTLTGNRVEVLEVSTDEAAKKASGHSQLWSDVRRDGRVVHGLDSPYRYGWSADQALVAGAGYITILAEGAEALRDQAGIRSVAVASYAPVQLRGHSVSAMGLEPGSGDTAVTVLEGRLPSADDQVALGTNSARELGVGVGDVIDDEAGDLTVAGIVALPAIGLAGVSHPSMAQGAVLTTGALSQRSGSAIAAVAFVDREDEADVAATTKDARLTLSTALLGGPSLDAVQAHTALRPAELVEVEPAKTTALALAAILGLSAVLALALTLGATVRHRRTQLAVLASLGFDARDLRRSVRWQTGASPGSPSPSASPWASSPDGSPGPLSPN